MKLFHEWKAALSAGETSKARRLKDKLVVDNYPLAVLLAGRYKRGAKTSTELEDMSQAGSIGIMRALDRYDPTRAKFSTYATFYIIAEIQKCIHADRKIAIPKAKKSEDNPMKFVAEREAKKQTYEDPGFEEGLAWDNYAALVAVLTPEELDAIENVVIYERHHVSRRILLSAQEKIAERARFLYAEPSTH